ncbi:retrovirus-related pol polyprotein from transposon TNT 1-94 [Tanacetum coccineum]
MDSQIISLNKELQDMREKYNELREENASKNHLNDDTPMCERHEANSIQFEGYQIQNSHDSYSHQSYHDPNDSKKSLIELIKYVRNDLKDFKRCVHSMRTVHWKLFARDDGKTTGVLPNKVRVILIDCKLSKLFCSIGIRICSIALDGSTVRFGNVHLAKLMGYETIKCKMFKHSHKPKAEDSIQEKLYLLHMDLCGPIRIQSINGRKYILVIIDDYSRFTWVKFLRSKDDVPEFVIKFLKMIQVRLNATVRNIRTDNGTQFVNQTLSAYYEEVRISHQTSVAHTLQQNCIVERRNRTLVEAVRTMLIFLKALLFL